MNESKVCPICRDVVPDNGDAALTTGDAPWALRMEHDFDPQFQLWHSRCYQRAAMLAGVDAGDGVWVNA